ncbi:hypothetical protein E1B28_011437 [Marasmius oreades]|uniref:Peptidase A1 domain-containing protein n=1 Tax=Marasmius oreades TaxID=181124 RepID=A0A9P7RU25_9AGAR|nr:uncharacterized protein E1B28_011437 [Marasmius oreades]KAG7089786.1 hypothetical protein E1B28_011437 [Marasmius oreades]
MQIVLYSSFFLTFTLFSLDGFVLGASTSVNTRLYSTPLQAVKGQISHKPRSTVPASVVHQQHINRALRRLSLATGRVPPSDSQFLTKIHERIAVEASHSCFHNEKRLNRVGVPGLFKLATATSKEETGGIINLVHGTEDDEGGHSTQLQIESTDVGYFCDAHIGTPARPFKLLVDTGSSDLWIPDENCHGDDENIPGCGPHASIGPNSSSTFQNTREVFFIFYVSGYALGNMVTDHVSIAQLTVQNLKFGAAIRESQSVVSANVPWDGILGLGQPALSRQPNTTSFLDVLKNQNQVSKNVVSFKIPRHLDAHKKNSEGEMTIGGLNPNQYHKNTLVTIKNVNKKGFWEVPIDGLVVNGVQLGWVAHGNRTGVLDTGTSLLVVTPSDADAIHALIPGARFDFGQKQWTIPCTSNTSMTFRFGNRSFTIDPRDLIFDLPINATTCYSGITAGKLGLGSKAWLVGDTILKNMYLSLNRETDEISFAQLK